jgi:hypothetical protein
MYFDNAATSFPKREAVHAEMDRFLRTAGANPGRSGHRRAVEADAAVARARQRLAQLLNAPRAERIGFTANGTEALNLAIKGLVSPGGHVVTTALEQNAVARPLRSLEKLGVRVSIAACHEGRFDMDALVGAIRPDTRWWSPFTRATSRGKSCQSKRSRRSAGSAGCATWSMPPRPRASCRSTCGRSAQTWWRCRDTRRCSARRVRAHSGSPRRGPCGRAVPASLSEQDEQPEALPDRFESGTLNSVGLAGLGAALGWIAETGREVIHQREQALTERLWGGLESIPGLALYGPPPGRKRRGGELQPGGVGADRPGASAGPDLRRSVPARAPLRSVGASQPRNISRRNRPPESRLL